MSVIKIKLADNEFEFSNDEIEQIPYLKNIFNSKNYKNTGSKYLELKTYTDSNKNEIFTNDIFDFISDYVKYWNIKGDGNYIRKKNSIYKHSLINKIILEDDLKMIYFYINSQIAKQKNYIKGNCFQVKINDLQIINKLLMNVNKLGMVGLSNKLKYLISNIIFNFSTIEFDNYIKLTKQD